MVGEARLGSRGVRRIVAALAGLVLVAGAGFVVYRVFAPGEVFAEATSSYPSAPTAKAPGVLGTLPSAPLIVDGRLRIVADKRQVRADGPVDSRYLNTPYWSFRRWPAQLIGVVVAGDTVVSRWSDGELVGLDSRTGAESWRANGIKPLSDEYDGRRTGAHTVYQPVGLFLAGDVVVTAGATETRAYDTATGTISWRVPAAPQTCSVPEPRDPAGFTTGDGRVAVSRDCDTEVTFLDAATGVPAGTLPLAAGPVTGAVVEPLGCAAPRADCAGVRVGGAAWLFARSTATAGPEGTPASAEIGPAASGLARPGSSFVDGAAVSVSATEVVAVGATDGTPRWTHALDLPGAEILAVEPGRVHLLTADRDLVTLDTSTGDERSRFRYTYFEEETDWAPGFAYAADGFVVTERLAQPVSPPADDADYYFDPQPVILATTR